MYNTFFIRNVLRCRMCWPASYVICKMNTVYDNTASILFVFRRRIFTINKIDAIVQEVGH